MSSASLLVPRAVAAPARPLGRWGFAWGRRGLILLGLGFAFLIPAFVDARFVAALGLWDAIVAVAWLIDLRRLPTSDRISVQREWLAPSALSVPGTIALTITNSSTSTLIVHIVDTVPLPLRSSPPIGDLTIRGAASAVCRYAVLPVRRGHVNVGATYLRYQSGLRLAERWAIADVAQTIVTYPNLADAQRQSIYLIRSRQIELERRSVRVRGTGLSFESLRDYREGDQFRDICWTASARRGKPVTRLYEVERSQTIWVLIDSGRLMRARVAGLSKLDYAVNAALSLAHVALNSGDRVGLLAYGRRITHRVPAASGSAHLMRLITNLAGVGEEESEADHLLAASRILTDQKRRSLIVWITDLAETAMTPDVVRAAAHLMVRHVVLAVVIGEPDLRALAQRDPDTPRAMYAIAAAQEVAHRRDLLLAQLRQSGVLAIETRAAALSPAVVNGYLDVKQRNRL